MRRASVTRLYRDKVSQNTILLLETIDSKEEVAVRVAPQRAGTLALEAHGLNDRCPLYGLILECVNQLGGAFGGVAIMPSEAQGTSAAISVSLRGQVKWLQGDFVELIALALHLQLPIFICEVGEGPDTCEKSVEIPSEFYGAFRHDSPAEQDEGAPSS